MRYLLILIFITCSIIAFAKKEKLHEVHVTITQTSSYCGGAAPPQEMLERLSRPQPYANQVYYIGKIGKKKSTFQKITSDTLGAFLLQLSAEKYVVFSAEKMKPLTLPTSNKYTKYDAACIRKQYATPDASFEIKNKNVEVNWNVHHACFYSLPCSTYRGPMPG
ncbi:MAG: hypothetical protein RLZZ118_1523 [Bacteroidota bacterium]|jgi:hypothetical protein